MLQMLRGLAHMHDRWFVHRDIKPSNLLYNNQGRLALADFGLARPYGEPARPYTHMVVTLWYRAPELLMGQRTYDSTAIDMWSTGCVFAEVIRRKVLLRGEGEIDQLDKTFKLLGAPSEANWPGYSSLPNAKGVRW